MPALANPRHEAFAQARFKGMSAVQAQVRAGFKPHDGNATRLTHNERIKARIAELHAEAARKSVENISFDAVEQFKRLQALINGAAAAGDFKAAVDGQKFMLKCFGYEDSPTLTHEHVLKKPLTPEQAETAQIEHDERHAQVIRFPHLLLDYKPPKAG